MALPVSSRTHGASQYSALQFIWSHRSHCPIKSTVRITQNKAARPNSTKCYIGHARPWTPVSLNHCRSIYCESQRLRTVLDLNCGPYNARQRKQFEYPEPMLEAYRATYSKHHQSRLPSTTLEATDASLTQSGVLSATCNTTEASSFNSKYSMHHARQRMQVAFNVKCSRHAKQRKQFNASSSVGCNNYRAQERTFDSPPVTKSNVYQYAIPNISSFLNSRATKGSQLYS